MSTFLDQRILRKNLKATHSNVDMANTALRVGDRLRAVGSLEQALSIGLTFEEASALAREMAHAHELVNATVDDPTHL